VNQILSSEEIAALVEAAKEGDVTPVQERTRRPRRVREIDFSRPSKFTQEQQRRIERAHETFCRSASTQLSAELRTAVELEVLNVAQHTWASALAEMPAATLYGLVSTEPLETTFLLGVELDAVTTMLTRLLGGVDSGRSPERAMTEIELSLARRLFGTLLQNLSVTWTELLGLSLALSGLEPQPQGVQLVMPAGEPCLVVVIEMRSEGTSSTLSLVVPYRSIHAVIEKLPSTHQQGEVVAERDPADAAAVEASLAEVATEVRAEVGAIELRIDDVLAIRPGDVLRLGSADLGVTLYADEVAVRRAKAGRSGSRRAVQVLERLEGVS
jgi:flagellar motor switch protein FliM